MIGDKLLVAPLLHKHDERLRIYVPKGAWRRERVVQHSEGEWITFACPEGLLVLVRLPDPQAP